MFVPRQFRETLGGQQSSACRKKKNRDDRFSGRRDFKLTVG
jgi:hypothetical protein